MKLPIKVTFRFPTAAETGRALGLKPAEIRKISALADEIAERFPEGLASPALQVATTRNRPVNQAEPNRGHTAASPPSTAARRVKQAKRRRSLGTKQRRSRKV